MGPTTGSYIVVFKVIYKAFLKLIQNGSNNLINRTQKKGVNQCELGLGNAFLGTPREQATSEKKWVRLHWNFKNEVFKKHQ